MRSSQIRFRRTFAVALALCTSAFIGVVAATPAQAAPPFAQEIFHPDGTPDSWAGNSSVGDYLTDKFDGHDNLAHLTGVATNDADRYRFYVCPLATANAVPATAGGPAALGCTFIGEDTSPVTPTFGGPFVGNADEAYEVFWDIPGSFDGLRRDIVGLACAGAETGSEPGGNCLAENEEDILLEDAPTATNQETSGEMVEFCTLTAGGCGAATIGPAGSGPEYTPYLHGITVPNDGYSMRSYVSDDQVSSSSMFDFGADAQTAPATSDLFSIAAGPIFTGVDYEVYEDSYSAGDITDDSEFAHALIEEFGGGGGPYCASQFCRPDTHYGASTERVAGQVHIHNDDDFAGGDDNGDDQCEDEGRTRTGEVGTGDEDEVIGCIFDQFSYFADFDGDGDDEKHTDGLMTEPGTFHITTDNAGFNAAFCEGTVHDLDNDGLNEFCAVPDPNNVTADDKHEGEFTAVAGGAINITFCHDPDAGDETDPNFGCGDAGNLRDTAAKNATPGFDHAHLRFNEDYVASPACHTGDVSKTKPAASSVPLTGCVQDQFHNGAPDIPVIWRFIAGTPAQFVSVEQETDANGAADAVVTSTASAEGQFTTVEFCTDFNNNGVCDHEDPGIIFPCPNCRATVQITWSRAGQQPPTGPCPNGLNKIRGSRGDDKLRGTVDCDRIKGRAGDDRLRGRAGNDVLVGGRGFDRCFGGPGRDKFRGCEIKKQ